MQPPHLSFDRSFFRSFDRSFLSVSASARYVLYQHKKIALSVLLTVKSLLMVASRQLVANLPIELTHVLPENGTGDVVDESAYINNDLFCTNIHEDQAQWRDKNQGIKQTCNRKTMR